MKHFNLSFNLGAYLIGVLVSYLLLGVLVAQTYLYFTRFPDDSAKIRVLVVLVLLCEAAQAICIAAALYSYAITGYGNPECLLRAPWTLLAAILFTGIICALVQGFFAFRIYALSKKLYVPCLCWILSVLRVVAVTAVLATGLRMVTMTSFEVHWGWLFVAFWSPAVANDLLVAVTQAFLLYRQRRNAHARTIPLVNKLIRWTIESGFVTCASIIITLILYYTLKDRSTFLAAFVVGSRRDDRLLSGRRRKDRDPTQRLPTRAREWPGGWRALLVTAFSLARGLCVRRTCSTVSTSADAEPTAVLRWSDMDR
ncbi:hypothetical protein GGX14DRAFT_673314 [Mycena pura]|uniref:DUF6534 domain-containing protein n=1 Tax=Mycena pura TaxID=153505 RepID=A0AAD6Y4M9_9AGAR|nr:hypothetical protein GGX14DRAFT_673314 [Mycena pura]